MPDLNHWTTLLSAEPGLLDLVTGAIIGVERIQDKFDDHNTAILNQRRGS